MRSLFNTRARKGQMLKREREMLTKMVHQYVLENGGTEHKEEGVFGYDLELPTLAGRLLVHPNDGAIFCRFDDEKTAAHVLALVSINTQRLNPHSGKWNWHFGRQTAKEAFAAFGRELEPILRPKVGFLEVVLAKRGVNVVAPLAFGEGGAGLVIAEFPAYGHDPAIRQCVRALVTAYNDRFFRSHRPVHPADCPGCVHCGRGLSNR